MNTDNILWIFDNGWETLDRFTFILKDNTWFWFSENPTSLNWVFYSIESLTPNEWLWKNIKYSKFKKLIHSNKDLKFLEDVVNKYNT